jgi:glycosyltransferase involved in cell wall biosynthesis
MINTNNTFSVIIPAFNEEDTLQELVERLVQTLIKNQLKGEIIIVDDGSKDQTTVISQQMDRKYDNVKVIRHKRRMGKTAALHTGFRNSSGEVVIILDADLQYIPEEIPKLLGKIKEGYDVVNGWRKDRHDSIVKKFPSKIYNFISRISFGLKLHDFNSGFKAFKKEVIEDLSEREGQHRFFINVAHYKGYNVGEVEIKHFSRVKGKTKYGFSRMFWGFFDLIALRLQLAFTERPMALFGLLGAILVLLGFIAGVYLLALRILYNEPFDQHIALMLFTLLLIIAGIQCFLFGFIADMVAKLKFEKNK